MFRKKGKDTLNQERIIKIDFFVGDREMSPQEYVLMNEVKEKMLKNDIWRCIYAKMIGKATDPLDDYGRKVRFKNEAVFKKFIEECRDIYMT